jgi:hypothetical protein
VTARQSYLVNGALNGGVLHFVQDLIRADRTIVDWMVPLLLLPQTLSSERNMSQDPHPVRHGMISSGGHHHL